MEERCRSDLSRDLADVHFTAVVGLCHQRVAKNRLLHSSNDFFNFNHDSDNYSVNDALSRWSTGFSDAVLPASGDHVSSLRADRCSPVGLKTTR